MPKLAAKTRKKVAKAEAVAGGDFEPLAPGKYIATLAGVEAKTSNAGNPMWVAEFEEIHDLDGDRQPGRQWYNLNLPVDTMPDDYEPKRLRKGQTREDSWENYQRLCEGRLKGFFEAFGYEVDSDTDEFVGEQCVIIIGVRTITQGARAGEKTNQVNGVAPLDSVDYEGAEDGGGEDEF
jgi:hypothetical protein